MILLIQMMADPIAAAESESTGFVMRNHAPFAALIGVPGRWPDSTGNFLDLTWNASSHSASERSEDFRVLTDGETHTLTARGQVHLWRNIGAGILGNLFIRSSRYDDFPNVTQEKPELRVFATYTVNPLP